MKRGSYNIFYQIGSCHVSCIILGKNTFLFNTLDHISPLVGVEIGVFEELSMNSHQTWGKFYLGDPVCTHKSSYRTELLIKY